MARRRSAPDERINVEQSAGYAEDIQRQPRNVQRRVAVFIRRKAQGKRIRGKEKLSGLRPDGSVIHQAFIDLNLYHYHLGNPDPVLVYQVLEGGRKIRLIAIANHTEIFHGNERSFLDAYGADFELERGLQDR